MVQDDSFGKKKRNLIPNQPKNLKDEIKKKKGVKRDPK
jgi:hypothetical protein